MQRLVGIAQTGIVSILLNPVRSAVTVLALVAVLLPYLAGLGVSQGVEREAELSIQFGPDLYVTGEQFGRNVPLPVEAVAQIQGLDGVTQVRPRIVGRVVLGTDQHEAVLVGVPVPDEPLGMDFIDGRFVGENGANEVVVGSELARHLKLKVGSMIPPFYRNAEGEHVLKVVGIFRSDVSLWQAKLIGTSFDTAAHVFAQRGLATDLLVDCRPGYQPQIRAAIRRLAIGPMDDGRRPLQLKATTAEELRAQLPNGVGHRAGVFNLHFVLAFSVGILVVLVTSGFGLADRRREIGILKATGWQTDEVLLRGLVESVALGLLAASASLLLAFAWLRWLNGLWIASIFLSGVDAVPAFQIPFRLTPVPALLAYLIGLVLVLTGTLYSSWRAATVPPSEAMR